MKIFFRILLAIVVFFGTFILFLNKFKAFYFGLNIVLAATAALFAACLITMFWLALLDWAICAIWRFRANAPVFKSRLSEMWLRLKEGFYLKNEEDFAENIWCHIRNMRFFLYVAIICGAAGVLIFVTSFFVSEKASTMMIWISRALVIATISSGVYFRSSVGALRQISCNYRYMSRDEVDAKIVTTYLCASWLIRRQLENIFPHKINPIQ